MEVTESRDFKMESFHLLSQCRNRNGIVAVVVGTKWEKNEAFLKGNGMATNRMTGLPIGVSIIRPTGTAMGLVHCQMGANYSIYS